MYKGSVTDVFFDLDHTLWDFERNSALTFEKIFLQQAIPLQLPDFLEVYIPINLNYWKMYREDRITKSELRYLRLKKTFDHLSIKVSDKQIGLLSEQYIQHLCTFPHLLPGTVEILEYLKPNYRLHIITNGFKETQVQKLMTSGIHDYFSVIVNSETAGVKKPHPHIFKLALKKAGVDPGCALMIGDNFEADIAGACAAGFRTLHLNVDNGPHHEKGPIIHHLHEIKLYL